ncbi:MAG: hypothetical protein IJU37_00935 [Desulfovibrio sp.]|nr:hypothetical protein [Desulfovibrio sp.]
MAQSPSHRLGQIIGDFLEELVLPLLEAFCRRHSQEGAEQALYLDKKGPRLARSGQKLRWHDTYGNAHDLDFVIERGGTQDKIGHPVAFIEAAWRRYPKHSKNKVQEIQGAVLPIAEKYAWDCPFMGAFLAGVFTEPAIEQMESVGFSISLFPYDTIVDAFSLVGVDVRFDEETADTRFSDMVTRIESLGANERAAVQERLLSLNKSQVDAFFSALDKALGKSIDRLYLIPLHGRTYEFRTTDEMVSFVRQYEGDAANTPLVKYEVFVKYTNGSEIRSQFYEKDEIYAFLDYISKSISTVA